SVTETTHESSGGEHWDYSEYLTDFEHKMSKYKMPVLIILVGYLVLKTQNMALLIILVIAQFYLADA
nr:putative matrix protein M [Tamana bat virus]